MNMIYAEISAAWPNIILAWSALLLLAIAPGPTVMAIMGISMSQGSKAGFLFTFGCMSGASIWAVLAGLGLSAWLTSFAHALVVMKIFGALYLLWMAYKSFKSALSDETIPPNQLKFSSKTGLFSRGLVLHITNPKAILGWAAVITLSQSETSSTAVLLFTLSTCLMMTFAIHFSYATIFASKSAMTSYKNARRWIEGVLACVFSFAGFRLLFG